MASFLRSENIVHVKDIVTVFVIVSIILSARAGFRKNSARVARRLIFKAWVANTIGSRQLDSEGLKGADEASLWVGATECGLRIDLGLQLCSRRQLLEFWNWAPGHLLGHGPTRRLRVKVKSGIQVAYSCGRIVILVTSGRVRIDGR
jgi:hypothetical protein